MTKVLKRLACKTEPPDATIELPRYRRLRSIPLSEALSVMLSREGCSLPGEYEPRETLDPILRNEEQTEFYGRHRKYFAQDGP